MKHRTILFFICIILAGCATTSLQPVTSENFALEEDEKRLWLRSEEEQKILNKSGLICEDESLEAYVNGVARKLQPQEVFKHIPFKVRVIKDPSFNAFALPHGAIYIHTGMLAKMENEAQLATLLAHEMTHSTHRHQIKEFRDLKNKAAFLASINVTLGGLASVFGALGTLASVTGYSRELETEADVVGLKLMVKAGYDPEESPKLFVHLKKDIEEEGRKDPFFFSTHPKIKERIENYENLLETEYREHKEAVKNSEIFLEKIRNVILDNASLDLKAGRFKTAQRGAEKKLSLDPNDAKAHYLLGEIFRQRGEKGDRRKAKEHYKKAISIDPSYPDPYKGIGLIHYKQGEKSLAKEYLESYLSISPQASDTQYIKEYIKHCNEGGGK